MIPVCFVDSMNLLYRVAHAFWDLKTSSGTRTGHYYGALRLLRDLKADFGIQEIVLVWDSMLSEDSPERYKAGREESELRTFVNSNYNDFVDKMDNLGFSSIRAKETEADYIIGDRVNYMSLNGLKPMIYSRDRDFYCLVDRAVVVTPSAEGNKVLTEEFVREYFKGIPISRIVMYRAFAGDNSDNLKGIPRLNREGIVKLLSKYNDALILEALTKKIPLPFLECFTRKSVENIIEGADRVVENYKLSDLRNMSIRKDSFDIKTKTPLDSEIQSFLDSIEMRSQTIASIRYITSKQEKSLWAG